MTFRYRKLLDLARDKPCMNCNRQDETVVAAHSNLKAHGRGYAHKSHDAFHAWLCVACHAWLDSGSTRDPTDRYDCTREDKELMFRLAMDRTWLHLWTYGLIQVASRNAQDARKRDG